MWRHRGGKTIQKDSQPRYIVLECYSGRILMGNVKKHEDIVNQSVMKACSWINQNYLTSVSLQSCRSGA
jgi:hypothetical protein